MNKVALTALQKLVHKRLNTVGFEAAIFKTLKVMSGGDGKCCCELKVTEQMINGVGTLHGGMTCSLVDAVSTYALSTIGTGTLGISIDLNVSFMRPAIKDDTVVIQASTLTRGKRIAVLNVDISNKATGKIIAQGRHTKYFTEANP